VTKRIELIGSGTIDNLPAERVPVAFPVKLLFTQSPVEQVNVKLRFPYGTAQELTSLR
jgi:hypothetical protein